MNYYEIKRRDVANGEGIRVSLWVCGCTLNCPGCFNKELQNPYTGQLLTDEVIDELAEMIKNPYIRGLSILGGEPTEHTPEITAVVKRLRTVIDEWNYNNPNRTPKDIWVWSGYKLEYLLGFEDKKSFLQYVDVLIDGRFIQSQSDPRLRFRGSTNQRIIDMPKTFAAKEVVLRYSDEKTVNSSS